MTLPTLITAAKQELGELRSRIERLIHEDERYPLKVQLEKLEKLMPILDDVLNAATTKLAAQAAQISSLQTQLATAQAAAGNPVLGLTTNTVGDANALGAAAGVAALDGTPLAQAAPSPAA